MKNLLFGNIALFIILLSVDACYWVSNSKNSHCHSSVVENSDKGNQYQIYPAEFDIPDIDLVSNLNKELTIKELVNQDKPVFLQFIFTSCPTICPVMSGHFAAFQDIVKENNQEVQLISVSIDPEYDTPARLNEFGKSFGALPTWTLLTGKKDDIVRLQEVFENYTGNKMYHRPVTYFKPPGQKWKVFDGFINGEELWKECRDLMAFR